MEERDVHTKTPALSRRNALIGLGGGLAAGLLHASGSHTRQATPVSSGPAQVHDITLVASEFPWELLPGVTVTVWGYNSQVPGPEIRVREGDLLRIALRNELPAPTTVHWHGLHVPPAMDGPAGLNQAAVNPGEEFRYEFIATPAGTRWYHSHADPQLQIPMGLYGPLIVEPLVPARPYAYDREHTLVLGEWDMELTPGVAAGTATRGPRDSILRGGELGADMFLINGHAHGAIPPLTIAAGERILLRLINAGHLAHPIHIHGHSFRIVATDGNPIPAGMEWTRDTVLIGPSERYDLELEGLNPGVWMVHCHIEHHMANGMMTVLQYDGHQPTGPARDYFDLVTGHEGHRLPHEASTPIPPNATAAAPADGSTATVAMADDRFEPSDITVATGTTVTWVNQGVDWHSVAAYDGSFESGKIAPGDTFSHRFESAGVYQYICKHHGLHGMIGAVTVEAS